MCDLETKSCFFASYLGINAITTKYSGFLYYRNGWMATMGLGEIVSEYGLHLQFSYILTIMNYLQTHGVSAELYKNKMVVMKVIIK